MTSYRSACYAHRPFGLERPALSLEANAIPVIGSYFRKDGRIKGRDDGGRIFVDHRQKCAGWRFGLPPSAFPMLDGVQAEAERCGKAGLGHLKLVPNALYVNLVWHMDLEALLLPG